MLTFRNFSLSWLNNANLLDLPTCMVIHFKKLPVLAFTIAHLQEIPPAMAKNADLQDLPSVLTKAKLTFKIFFPVFQFSSVTLQNLPFCPGSSVAYHRIF
jgi:hypothetical protein